MGAAIEVQQLPEAGARLAPLPMAAAGPALAHQARFLQRQLDETVGEPHAMLALRQVVEVAHVKAEVALAVQAQDSLHLGHRRLQARGAPTAPIIEPKDPLGLIARPPAPQTAGLDAQDVRRLQPRQRPTQCPQNHLLYLHRPLQRGRRIEHGHSPFRPSLYPTPPEKADISFALGSGHIMYSLQISGRALDRAAAAHYISRKRTVSVLFRNAGSPPWGRAVPARPTGGGPRQRVRRHDAHEQTYGLRDYAAHVFRRRRRHGGDP